MIRTYGRNQQVRFETDEEFYTALGFLANSNHAEIVWERNDEQGVWGSEGRIHCHVDNFPPNFALTAGRGSIIARINCNEFVQMLVTYYHFCFGGNSQNTQKILSAIPQQYHTLFWNGYNS